MSMDNKHAKNNLFYALFALIVIFSLGTPSLAFTLANKLDAPKVKPCKGLDIVFLVSYSSPTKFNDGVGLRRRAMTTALDILGDNAIYLCPGFEHRIAVVGFGDYLGEFVPPTNISPSLNKLGEWTAQKYKLLQLIPNEQDLGRYSNFQDGLKRASDILASWRKEGFDPTKREQAVLIISDGDMCKAENLCDFDETPSRVFQGILPIVDPSSNELSSRITISHIGFFTTSGKMFQFWDRPSINEFWSNIVEQHSGKFFLLQSGGNSINQDIDSKVSAVLNDLLGSSLGIASCDSTGNGLEPIWVEPYRNNFLILYVYRTGSETGNIKDVSVTINITKSDGTTETIVNGTNKDTGDQSLGGNKYEFNHEGPNDIYKFYQPPVGKYSITIQNASPCKDISVLSGAQGVTAELLAPKPGVTFVEHDLEPYYDVASPVKFSFQLSQMDSDGQSLPLSQIDGFLITAKIYLKSIDGTKEPPAYDLGLIDVNKSIWESEPISLQFPDKYTWELVLQTKNPRASDPIEPDTTPIVVYRMQGDLEIKPLVRNFNFEVISPSSSEQEVLLTDKIAGKPMGFQIQLYNATDKMPLREDLRISEASQTPFTAKLQIEKEGQFSDVDSEPMVWEKGNKYSVELNPSSIGKFESGNYRLLIELNDDYNKQIYKYTAGKEPVQRDFLISVVTEQEFQWGLVRPVNGAMYSLRPALNWFDDPDLTDFFSIEVRSKGNKPISTAESMLKPGESILFKGTLKGPDGKTYEILYSPKKDSTLFVAQWPKDALPKGEYTLEKVEIESGNLTQVWVNPTESTKFPIKFTFNKLPWTEPWSGLAAMILGAILLLAVVLVYLNVGPLFDTMIIFTVSRGVLDPIEGGVRLYRTFVTHGLRISGKELSQQIDGGGVKEILVKSIKPTKPGARVATDIDLMFDDQGDVLHVADVNEGDEVLIGPGQKLTLSKGEAGFVQRLMPVIAISLILLVVWLAGSTALYFLV